MSYDDDALTEILEDVDDEDWDERRRRSKGRQVKPASPQRGSGNVAPARSSSQTYVTHAQLQTALEKVGEQIGKNASAIRALDDKSESRAIRADKALVTLRKDMKRVSEMSAMLPLLTQKTVDAPKDMGLPAGTKLLVGGDSFATMLPLMLMGGMGGSGGSGGEDNSMMMMALLLATQGK